MWTHRHQQNSIVIPGEIHQVNTSHKKDEVACFWWPINTGSRKKRFTVACVRNLIIVTGLTISSPGSQYPSCSMPALEPLQPTVRVSTTRPSFTAKLSCLAVSLGCMPNTRLRYLCRWRSRNDWAVCNGSFAEGSHFYMLAKHEHLKIPVYGRFRP